MPSFDVVSKFDLQEVTNALDQANREVGTRFDFKGVEARYERAENVITMKAETESQLEKMLEILYQRLSKRGLDLKAAEPGKPEQSGKTARQTVTIKQGVDTALAREIVRLVKDSKIKVQAAIQGDQVRITGKKRDDLQAAIAMLRAANLALPLQYVNFRD
ncbi:MAG: YajQ family cyclic di-GMP-binding protein [Gammaproteobacteria bacterium]